MNIEITNKAPHAVRQRARLVAYARRIADETGRSIRDVASRMIDFAFEHIRYEDAEPPERS